jgi:alpha-tubulin suppressor-like RCC1 family protein
MTCCSQKTNEQSLHTKQTTSKEWKDIKAVAAGEWHTLGLKTDGTVVATGSNTYGQCNVDDWTDIEKIYAGGYLSVGVKSNGEIIVIGNDFDESFDFSEWPPNIIKIAVSNKNIVGLSNTGTVHVAGNNEYGQCNTQDWSGIVDITSSSMDTMGVKKDGSIVLTKCLHPELGEYYRFDYFNISPFPIALIATDGSTAACLTDDGVFSDIKRPAMGDIHNPICSTNKSQYIAITAGSLFFACLSMESTVAVYEYYPSSIYEKTVNWTNIIDIASGRKHIVGLKSDGTVVASGENFDGQCDVD